MWQQEQKDHRERWDGGLVQQEILKVRKWQRKANGEDAEDIGRTQIIMHKEKRTWSHTKGEKQRDTSPKVENWLRRRRKEQAHNSKRRTY